MFEDDFVREYQGKVLPSQFKALSSMKQCRSVGNSLIKLCCSVCEGIRFIPHSCGHRNCPHCQNHESWNWIERECQKRVNANYFMLTFTLPSQFRDLVYLNQRVMLSTLYKVVWDTVSMFCNNDKQLGGIAGATAVLHTHSRRLEYHPHIHLVIPAAVIDSKQKLWKRKRGKYLFNHKALAKVFRAKMLEAIKQQQLQQQLELPKQYPEKWVVDCKNVGSGEKAITYLGRYLYRGVIAEKDIVSVKENKVTFRYFDSKTKKRKTRTVSGVCFLKLVLQHVLPKRFRRARSFGFLHPNSKVITPILRYMFKVVDPSNWIAQLKDRPEITCKSCGGKMLIVQTRIIASDLPVLVPG